MARAGNHRQQTLRGSVSFQGVGVHSGAPATLSLFPAKSDSGIVFVRSDLENGQAGAIPARHHLTATTELATVIGDKDGAAVSTIEHVMAALYGLGVDNAVICIDGPEVPILDGSALPFVDAIRAIGVERQDKARRYLKVKRPVRLENGQQFGELLPHDGFSIDVEIIYPDAEIGHQRVVLDISAATFERELAGARTFGFYRDVERLRAAGFARGASLENTVVIGSGEILNREGLRYSDEFVRHKALDAVGDLSLIGMPVLGLYRSSRGGHKLNAAVVAALLADPANFDIVELVPEKVVPVLRPHKTAANAVAAQAAVQTAVMAPERR